MKGLSWIFFCLTPFGYFCTENGTGLITGTVFLMLGFVFKWLGNNSDRGNVPKEIFKIEPNKFWEWHYKDGMSKGRGDEEARKWATTIAQSHGCWVPPKEEQERIARASGVTTDTMRKTQRDYLNRIQFGKYYLTQKMGEEYRKKKSKAAADLNEYFKMCRISDAIFNESSRIRYVEMSGISFTDFNFLRKNFGTIDVDIIWKSVLSENERAEAKKWTDELVKRLDKEDDDYRMHKKYPCRGSDYEEKYGFSIRRKDLI